MDIAKERTKPNRKIGGKRTPEYRAWANMKARCKNIAYKHYAGRGIKVCDRWKSFDAFFDDMGPRPEGDYSIDRIDNDGNYEPGNCRWVLRLDNMRNRRNTVKITAYGLTGYVDDWCRITELKKNTLLNRLRSGWSHEKAVMPFSKAPADASEVHKR